MGSILLCAALNLRGMTSQVLSKKLRKMLQNPSPMSMYYLSLSYLFDTTEKVKDTHVQHTKSMFNLVCPVTVL